MSLAIPNIHHNVVSLTPRAPLNRWHCASARVSQMWRQPERQAQLLLAWWCLEGAVRRSWSRTPTHVVGGIESMSTYVCGILVDATDTVASCYGCTCSAASHHAHALIDDAPVASTTVRTANLIESPKFCPVCGTNNIGKPSCCAPDGAWRGQCGDFGETDEDIPYTWTEGIEACKGEWRSG